MGANDVESRLILIDEMSNEIKAIRANVEANFKRVNEQAKQSQTAFGNLGSEIKGSFVNAVKSGIVAYAGFQVIGKVTGFLKDARKEYKEHIEIQLQLRAALGYTSDALNEQSKALEKQLTLDGEIVSAVQLSLSYFEKDEEKLKELTVATLDFAAATGMDAKSAAMLLGRSIESGGALLTRYGIKLKQTNSEQAITDQLIKAVTERFGGQAVALNASSDMWDKIGIAIKNVKEELWGMFKTPVNVEQMGLEQLRKELAIQKELLTGTEGINIDKTLESISYLQGRISEIEKNETDRRLAATKEKIDEHNAAVHTRTLELKKKLWETELAGRTKMLAVEMQQELESFTGTQEQKVLIVRRYEALIAQEREEARQKQAETQKAGAAPGMSAYAEWKAKDEEEAKAIFEKNQERANLDLEIQRDVAQKEQEMRWENYLWQLELNNKKVQARNQELLDEERHAEMLTAIYANMATSMGDAIASSMEDGNVNMQKMFRAILVTWLSFIQRQLVASVFANAAKKFATAGIPGLLIAGAEGAALTAAFEIAKGKISGFESGTRYAPGGMAMVGERGPEMMYVPRGAQIYNNTETRHMETINSGSSVTVNVLGSNGQVVETLRASMRSGDGRRLARDIVRVAQGG